MRSPQQINRMQHEYETLLRFTKRRQEVTLFKSSGSPPSFYQLQFHNIRTSVTEQTLEPFPQNPKVEIRPVSFELAINLEESFPLQKPGLSVSPAHDEEGLCLLYNSHIFLFAVCLFSRWRMHYSLVDVVCRLYNILTYNHNLVNLDRLDVLNPRALAWYKEQAHGQPDLFPLASAMTNTLDAPDVSKRHFQFIDLQQES
ncbi:hypothetical protein JXO59_05375 [candidate division KSB1 bacterium]|nr:hypothetical protein [candidate division KSB1 bacterium]